LRRRSAGVYLNMGDAPAYPSIADHGLIGDLRTAALVASDATIDWLCVPRFDSPSVFGALLDAKKGGAWRLTPMSDSSSRGQHYLPASNVLVTRF
jgi:GH15 family glucan-1,4-alpha-glucosidase